MDSLLRLKKTDTLELFHYLIFDALRFAHENQLQSLTTYIESACDELTNACENAQDPKMRRWTRFLSGERKRALLDEDQMERERLKMLERIRRKQGLKKRPKKSQSLT